MDFLITGCGRSGTKYVAERLNSSGILCGHEKIFTVYGFSENNYNCYQGDSSWFAVPFLSFIRKEQPVLHLVRNPVNVVKSFYRIGIFSNFSLRQFSKGNNIFELILFYKLHFREIRKRYEYIRYHRNFLKTYTSCWKITNEIDRLWEYWYQWNKLIEENVYNYDLKYLRVNLEQIDHLWPVIKRFLEIETILTPGSPVNTKPKFKRRIKQMTPPSQKIIDLANRYGYQDILKDI